MKNALLLALVGAFIGIVAASVIVPPFLGWYTSPGGLPGGAQVSAVVQIPEVIRYATSKLMLGQSVGAGLGAIAGLAIYFFSQRPPAVAPPATPRADAAQP